MTTSITVLLKFDMILIVPVDPFYSVEEITRIKHRLKSYIKGKSFSDPKLLHNIF